MDDGAVRRWLEGESEKFGWFLDAPERYRLQVMMSELSEDRAGERGQVVRTHGFRVDAEYVYPASTVKLVGAVAALKTLRRLGEEWGERVDIETPLVLHPVFEDQQVEDRDATNVRGGAITAGQEIRKVFLVSDNPAHNRLYGLVGHRAINEMMWDVGLEGVRVRHRLSEARTVEENLRTPRVDVRPASGVRTIPARVSTLRLEPNVGKGVLIGRAHVADGRMVDGPMDFALKNALPVSALHALTIMAFAPDVEMKDRAVGLGLHPDDAAMLRRVAAMDPGESENPVYDLRDYPRGFNKFFLSGLERVRPAGSWVVMNKVGQAYGFTLDSAVIVEKATGRRVALTAAVYTNSSEVLNTDAYEYAQDALPLMADVAEVCVRKVLAGK